MKDTTSTHDLIRVAFESSQPSLLISSDWVFIGIIIAIIIAMIILKRQFSKLFRWQNLEVEISGTPK